MSAPNAREATPIAASLRAEHDDLSRRLEIRPSIDELRKGLVRLFVGLIATGLTVEEGIRILLTGGMALPPRLRI